MLLKHVQFVRAITEGNDPILWLLVRGQELERACNFAIALKYYFAGKMFFARLHQNQELYRLVCGDNTARSANSDERQQRKRKKLEEEFKRLYRELLPMTNAEVSFIISCLFVSLQTLIVPPRLTRARESLFTTKTLCSGAVQ
jgi:hypothetical protein